MFLTIDRAQGLQDIGDNGTDILRSPDFEEPVAMQPGAEDDGCFPNESHAIKDDQSLSYETHISADDDAFLPPTLETRRRKKANITPMDIEFKADPVPSPIRDDSETRMNPGTKRKFSVHHGDRLESTPTHTDSLLPNLQSPLPVSRAGHSLSPGSEGTPSRGKVQPSGEGTINYRPAKRKALEHSTSHIILI